MRLLLLLEHLVKLRGLLPLALGELLALVRDLLVGPRFLPRTEKRLLLGVAEGTQALPLDRSRGVFGEDAAVAHALAEGALTGVLRGQVRLRVDGVGLAVVEGQFEAATVGVVGIEEISQAHGIPPNAVPLSPRGVNLQR